MICDTANPGRRGQALKIVYKRSVVGIMIVGGLVLCTGIGTCIVWLTCPSIATTKVNDVQAFMAKKLA